MIDFHHAPQAENVRFGRNNSATRLGGEDAALRERSCLVSRYLHLRRTSCVKELVEALVKIGISQQSILVTPHVVERHALLCGAEDQPPLFVDGVSHSHFSVPSEHVT